LRYVDFDSAELAEYPKVHRRVVDERDLEPGVVMIADELVPIFDVPYERLIQEFENIGALRVRKAS